MTPDKITKTDDEWRQQLTPEQFRVARENGTEAPFSGRYWNTKDHGTYVCVCCGQALYSSKSKFDSGTGWPSFGAAVTDEAVRCERDASHGMVRTEALCARCDAHLGHVFEDGPGPTGMRHCINSASLKLEEEGE